MTGHCEYMIELHMKGVVDNARWLEEWLGYARVHQRLLKAGGDGNRLAMFRVAVRSIWRCKCNVAKEKAEVVRWCDRWAVQKAGIIVENGLRLMA